jgi:plasmid maintenance system antidote protein VapI
MQTGLRPIHPGEFLAEILNELDGSRPVTADLALRFAKAFNQTPQYWLNADGLLSCGCSQDAWTEAEGYQGGCLMPIVFGEMRRVGLGFH